MGKYSDTLMDHSTSPRNAGAMESPDLVGHAGEIGRGPFLILYLKMGGGRVASATFQTYGCGVAIASGSALTEAIAGRTVAECLDLTYEDIVAALDGVPCDKLHGPALAIAALRRTLEGYDGVRR
jgi:NifU-like protein involved in Fe-S cluster formation